MTSRRRYCLITPCRDEARFARTTLEAVTGQSLPPDLWIIVDDGSTDQTPQILAEYAARFPYIKVLHRPDRGDRSLGGGVIDAFYFGYKTVNPDDFDYLCKLDLDLDLPPQYFELLMHRMEEEPRLGTCSGKPYYRKEALRLLAVPDGLAAPQARTIFPLANLRDLVSEKCGDENSVGMTKFYRTQCFKQIGGFVPELMWDGIDGHRCRMHGWLAESWDDPGLRFEHLRPMGTSHKSWFTGRMRHGIGQYFMGTTVPYMLASGIFRMSCRPRIIGGLAMLWGYVKSAATRAPQYRDTEFRRFLRRYQWSCLLLGKDRATRRLNRRQAAAWHASGQCDVPAPHLAPSPSAS